MRRRGDRPGPAGSRDRDQRSAEPARAVDFLVVGVGVCGLFQLYRLLELGADVMAVDSNDDVGGTWYNNRYPGCRFDSESYTYQYSFSEELLNEWNWSERFAGQPEALAYLCHVADKFDLRRHIWFGATVQKAEWDEARWRWQVRTSDGRTISARYVLYAMGLLSVPTYPKLPGTDQFEGRLTHTFDWPDDLDVTGLRVAVIGTGASGVQVISAIADSVRELYVLQRSANWCTPLGNGPISSQTAAELRSKIQDIFAWCRETPAGFIHRPDRLLSTDVSREERIRRWETLYYGQGAGMALGNYRDTMMEEEPNRELSEFVAGKIRQRVRDPKVAELLIPTDHGFGTKRVGGESGFYEVFNRDNVELIDIKATPIERLTRTGIRLSTEDGARDLEVDVVVTATGFDAVVGPFDRIDIRGTGGLSLREKWRDGPTTLIGVQVSGFPNMFILVGPQSGSATANFPRGIEDVVDWTTGVAGQIQKRGAARIEARPDAEAAWVDHVRDVNSRLLLGRTKSWFTGYNSNLSHRDQVWAMVYLGGAPRYRRRLAEEAENGYPSFTIEWREEDSV